MRTRDNLGWVTASLFVMAYLTQLSTTGTWKNTAQNWESAARNWERAYRNCRAENRNE
jgi:hypothetical protein